jgi:hypothetical protein
MPVRRKGEKEKRKEILQNDSSLRPQVSCFCILQYGNKICPNINKPLFHNTAWKKANNLLKEILDGFYSDIPGVSYYRFKLNDNGDIAHNFLARLV